jgi:hypothetical protein
MQTLSLSLRTKGPEGEPLPAVFKWLDLQGALIRRGQVTLIAGASGVGKSSLITWMAMNMIDRELERVPTLYFSADSDVTTFGIRAGTMATSGLSTRQVEELILRKDSSILDEIEEATKHIWICFDSNPDGFDISNEIDAYAMVTGEYPSLIVVDNLMDVQTGGFEERQGQDAVLAFLKQLSTRTQAAVVVLCHVVASGRGTDSQGNSVILDYASGKVPIPLSGLMNKIDKRPRLILTLFESDDCGLGVCIVKNNNGRRDAEGLLWHRIPRVQETMTYVNGW